MKVFISHSSSDEDFVQDLALNLSRMGVSVWYDDWEIKVGDSIVEKVFDGLEKSDALIIVLSKVSVESKWVKEELNTAIIRRIAQNDILLLPVYKEDCTIPISLKQFRYADFRSDFTKGFIELFDAIEPMRVLWQSLQLLKKHHRLIVAQIKTSDLESDISNQINELHEVMSSAVDVRCQIEFRQAKTREGNLDFFRKIEKLADKGLEIRSRTWNMLVSFRAELFHEYKNVSVSARWIAERFRERSESDGEKLEDKEMLDRVLDRLTNLMEIICDQPIEFSNEETTID